MDVLVPRFTLVGALKMGATFRDSLQGWDSKYEPWRQYEFQCGWASQPHLAMSQQPLPRFAQQICDTPNVNWDGSVIHILGLYHPHRSHFQNIYGRDQLCPRRSRGKDWARWGLTRVAVHLSIPAKRKSRSRVTNSMEMQNTQRKMRQPFCSYLTLHIS